jgi:thioredoxin reductase (NADPH)
MPEEFDTVIVGGGPAALSAAIYAGRSEMKTLVLERQYLGGQVATTWQIENYPGFPEGVEGPELTERMRRQAERFGAQFRNEEVTRIRLEDDVRVTSTSENEYRSPTLILAMGADPRKLDVPGEKELRGRGVSYCGTCDAPFFRDKRVVVVGGGDVALKEALFIDRFASEVVLVHRRDEFRAEPIYRTELTKHPKITVRFNTVVEKINGAERVEGVDVRDVETGRRETVPCEGVFVFIGHEPNTGFLCNVLPNQCMGELETDGDMMTKIPGVFAVGDVRRGSYRQIATAVGEGATAAIAAEHWLAEHKGRD